MRIVVLLFVMSSMYVSCCAMNIVSRLSIASDSSEMRESIVYRHLLEIPDESFLNDQVINRFYKIALVSSSVDKELLEEARRYLLVRSYCNILSLNLSDMTLVDIDCAYKKKYDEVMEKRIFDDVKGWLLTELFRAKTFLCCCADEKTVG